MTAATLAQWLWWMFVAGNVGLCALALYAGGRLHRVEKVAGCPQIPPHTKRAVVLSFGVPLGAGCLGFVFPAVMRGGSPVALAAMMLCAIGAVASSIFFVLGTLQTFAVVAHLEHDGHRKDNGVRRVLPRGAAELDPEVARTLARERRPPTRH